MAVTDTRWSNLVPGGNPTGVPISFAAPLIGTGPNAGVNTLMPAQNPVMSAPWDPNPYSSGFVPTSGSTSVPTSSGTFAPTSASTSAAPPFSSGSVPTFGANTGGGYTSSSLLGPPGTNPISGVGDITGRQQGRTLGELQNQYGEGLGALMYQFLQGGAGFNQQAINNLLASMQPGIERGTESLMEQFSASGNRFGSGAQIGLADYLSQVNLNQGQLETQMYESSLKNYMDVLTGVSSGSQQQKMASPGFFDYFSAILGGAQQVGSAALMGG